MKYNIGISTNIVSVSDYLLMDINGIPFNINFSTAQLVGSFFIDADSKLFKYIKTKQFVDDLQDILFETDNYKYAAEEVQWIIIKDGLCKDAYITTQFREFLDTIHQNNPVYCATKYNTSNICKELESINPSFNSYIKNKFNRWSDDYIRWCIMPYVFDTFHCYV